MRGHGITIARAALEGGFVAWEAGTPRFLLADDRETRVTVGPYRGTLAAILRRAQCFYHQLQVPGAPCLQYRKVKGGWRGLCDCCGGPTHGEPLGRCALCSTAMDVALAQLEVHDRERSSRDR